MYIVCTTIYGKKILIPKENLINRSAVYGLVINNGHILLTKVKSTGKLWFPGGLIEKGESEETTLTREVLEETGIGVTITKKLLDTEQPFYHDPTKYASFQTSSFYICKCNDRKLKEIHINVDTEDEAIKPNWYLMESLKEEDFQDYAYLVLVKYNKLTWEKLK